MKRLNQIIIQGITLGITFGLLISLIICYIDQTYNYYPSTPIFVHHFNTPLNALTFAIVSWAILGISWTLSILIFKNPHWTLLKQTTFHFLCIYIITTIIGIINNWFNFKIIDLLIYTSCFILFYIISYFIHYRKIKKDIQQINKIIKK